MSRIRQRPAWIAMLVVLSVAPLAVLAAQDVRRPMLAAIFAHPDDEIAMGPLLARYGREGIDVRLVLATNGDRGTRITNIPAGEALGRARAQEALCSTERLGIPRPMLLDFGDGTLAVSANLRRLEAEIARTLKALNPAAVVTWGPEGLDGHPDHRIVGAVVTEIIQGWPDGDPPALYYPGFPPDRAAAAPESPFSRTPTLDRYLTVRIPFEPRDFEATWAAFACHETQYTKQERDAAYPLTRTLLNGHIYLRPAFAQHAPRADIFR